MLKAMKAKGSCPTQSFGDIDAERGDLLTRWLPDARDLEARVFTDMAESKDGFYPRLSCGRRRIPLTVAAAIPITGLFVYLGDYRHVHESFFDRESGPPGFVSPDQEKGVARIVRRGDTAPSLEVQPGGRGVRLRMRVPLADESAGLSALVPVLQGELLMSRIAPVEHGDGAAVACHRD